VTTVPASECPRITPAFLAQQKAAMTPLDYASEAGVEFVEAGSAFRRIAELSHPGYKPEWLSR
jgi:hypothetical protein